MQTGTIHRLYIGGRYGSDHDRAGELIPDFDREVQALAALYLDGATLLRGTGLWEGQTEPCAIIETLIHEESGSGELAQVLALALAAKEQFAQDAIMHTTMEIGFSFV